MARFVLRRVAATLPVLLGIVFLVMALLEFIPGDPAALMLGDAATPQAVAALRHQIGLDRPLVIRYAYYVSRLAVGNLGLSIRENRPVAAELRDTLPATFQLGVAALAIAVVGGVTLGGISAARRNTALDNLIRVASLVGISMPIFWTGLVLIIVFSLWLRLLPPGGIGTLSHLILPAVTLAAPSLALVARMARSAVLEVLGEDYVRTAHSKGADPTRVLFRHAVRNALIPVVTVVGLQAGQLLGGTVITETVFAWPGMGRMIVNAIFSRDFVLLQGGILVLAVIALGINLLVDLTYAYLDPRISYA